MQNQRFKMKVENFAFSEVFVPFEVFTESAFWEGEHFDRKMKKKLLHKN